MGRIISAAENIRPILGAIKSVPVPARLGQEHGETPPPFVTISRQPGGGAWSLAQRLVPALNEAFPSPQEWTCWDRELVEKVAADQHVSQKLIETLEDRGHSWFSDFLNSLSFSDKPAADEAKIYSRVAASIRALAKTGRVVIVGRGGVFITHRMPGGIHIRLVAPLEQRIAFMKRVYQFSTEQAAAHIRELERHRQAFYKHYWPHESLGPETFALTINTAVVTTEAAIEAVVALVRQGAFAKR